MIKNAHEGRLLNHQLSIDAALALNPTVASGVDLPGFEEDTSGAKTTEQWAGGPWSVFSSLIGVKVGFVVSSLPEKKKLERGKCREAFRTSGLSE